MEQRPWGRLPRLLVLVTLSSLSPAEIIDRVAVSVGTRVITTSDIEREIRVSSLQNRAKPEFTPDVRRATSDRLIEQTLVRIELESSSYRSPDPAEVEPVLAQFKKEHFKNEEEYQAALKEYGLTEQAVKDALLWQGSLLLFVAERFRPAIQVDEQEIQQYFEKEVAPAARAARPGQEPSLEEYRDQIEETITGKRVDQEMDKWLMDAKRRTLIFVHPEAFQ